MGAEDAAARARQGTPVGGIFYNTNGFAFHRLDDVVRILSRLGYDGIALTPDVHHLDPWSPSSTYPDEVLAFRRLLDEHELGVVIETGARFVLDPSHKHHPTLLDEPPLAARRLDFLERCVALAVDLGAPVVTVWSGRAPQGTDRAGCIDRLVRGLQRLCDRAEASGVRIGFEPEPGMLIERADQWPEIRDRVDKPALGLTLDIGHCLATGEGAPDEVLRRHAADLLVLQLDDHRPGVHDHLAFGDGDVDFQAVARSVRESGFRGPLEVELSRHASTAPATAEASIAFLHRVFGPDPTVQAP